LWQPTHFCGIGAVIRPAEIEVCFHRAISINIYILRSPISIQIPEPDACPVFPNTSSNLSLRKPGDLPGIKPIARASQIQPAVYTAVVVDLEVLGSPIAVDVRELDTAAVGSYTRSDDALWKP
jgi:hypothetical protein